MATRLTLADDDGNAIECFLNNNNTVQINVATDSDESLSTASISLHKENVIKLITHLTKILAGLQDSSTINENIAVV